MSRRIADVMLGSLALGLIFVIALIAGNAGSNAMGKKTVLGLACTALVFLLGGMAGGVSVRSKLPAAPATPPPPSVPVPGAAPAQPVASTYPTPTGF